MSHKKDKQIAELQQRVEQLARGQSFWITTASNALGGVISVVVVAIAVALWNNPELFGWFTVPRLVSAVVVVIGILSMVATLYFAVKAIKIGWGDWNRRMQFLFLSLDVSEVGSMVVAALLYFSFTWQD